MKILEIIPDLEKRAGAEVFFESLCLELAKNKKNEIVVVTIWNLLDPSFDRLFNSNNIRFYCCGKEKKGISWKAIKMLKKIVLEEQPDIIHTHRSVLLTYFFAFGFKKTKWKLLHTVHNVADKEAGKYEILLRKRYLRKMLINQIGISDSISKTIKDLYGVSPASTIYNGIESHNCKITNSKEFDFICVARFSKQKNHKLLIDAFGDLLEEFPSLKLVLVGKGELEEECRLLVSKRNLNNDIIFYGSADNIYDVMSKSKCFVLSSLYEGNPISILEAMSLGLPVIAPNVGGVPDVVINNKNGLLFQVGDKNGLLDSMKKLISDNSLFNRISKTNISECKKYSISNCAKEYEIVFNSLLNTNDD